MKDGAVSDAEICVVGRTDFSSGIGRMTLSACQMLARSFPVCILPTEPHARSLDRIPTPDGGGIRVCHDSKQIKVWFFADVLWNGVHDFNYTLLGEGLRIAQIVFDSTQLPPEWVGLLNDRFDAVVVTSSYMLKVAQSSGVNIPIGVLPIALDNENLLSRPFSERSDSGKLSFLSIGAFHSRKNHHLTIAAFAEAFANDINVQLLIHSNLAFEDTFYRLQKFIDEQRLNNVTLSHGNISEAEKLRLMENCDVYLNCSQGEGFSIGARDALALGKVCVLSETGAHLDLLPAPGVFAVPAQVRVPARYPEINNRIFGSQFRVEKSGIVEALKSSSEFVLSGDATASCRERRALARQSSGSALWRSYAEVIDTCFGGREPRRESVAAVSIPSDLKAAVAKKIGSRAFGLSAKRNVVVPVHDGGYYSLFNCFFSNLVWNLKESECGWTLPDWDVNRFIARQGTLRVGSFCYGAPSDGNFWTKLYDPLFGFSEDEMNSESVLYERSRVENPPWNAHREPLLTHVNAFRLYQTPDFYRWRRWYNRVYQDHIRLNPKLSSEIKAFSERNFGDRFVVAAHVRHPSHLIEQPGKQVAATDYYIDEVRNQLARRGHREMDDSWRVFLATDQEHVTKRFVDSFGDRVSFFTDVRRTKAEEDSAYSAGSAETQGHQVQHIVASNVQNWSTRMAEEIIRDATVMAACNVLIHIVSNVSTAVSYINPEIELVLAKPVRG